MEGWLDGITLSLEGCEACHYRGHTYEGRLLGLTLASPEGCNRGLAREGLVWEGWPGGTLPTPSAISRHPSHATPPTPRPLLPHGGEARALGPPVGRSVGWVSLSLSLSLSLSTHTHTHTCNDHKREGPARQGCKTEAPGVCATQNWGVTQRHHVCDTRAPGG